MSDQNKESTTTPPPATITPPQISLEKVKKSIAVLTHQNYIDLPEQDGRKMLKQRLNQKQIDLVYETLNKIPPEIKNILKERKKTPIIPNPPTPSSSISRFSALSRQNNFFQYQLNSQIIKGFNIASLAVISSLGANYLINKSLDKKQNAIINQKNGEIQAKVNSFNQRLRVLQSDIALLPARYVGVQQLNERLNDFKNQTHQQVAQLKSSQGQPVKRRQLQLKFTPFSQNGELLNKPQQPQMDGSFISDRSHKIVSSVENLQSQFKKMGEHLLRIADEIKDTTSTNKKDQRLGTLESILSKQKRQIGQLEKAIYKKNLKQTMKMATEGGIQQGQIERQTANNLVQSLENEDQKEENAAIESSKFQILEEKPESQFLEEQFKSALSVNVQNDNQSQEQDQQLKQQDSRGGLTTGIQEEKQEERQEEVNIQNIQIRKDEDQNDVLNLFVGNFEKDQARLGVGKVLNIPLKSILNNPDKASQVKINPANQSYKVMFQNKFVREFLQWLGFQTKFSSIYQFSAPEDQQSEYKARIQKALDVLLGK